MAFREDLDAYRSPIDREVVVGVGPKPGSKLHRDRLRARLAVLGFSGERLTRKLYEELVRECGCRPREAWRLACGLSLDEVAARFNTLLDDPRAPMRKGRIWDYEKWPSRGARPTVRTLRILARIYGVAWVELVDLEDLAAMPEADRGEYHAAVTDGGAFSEPLVPARRVVRVVRPGSDPSPVMGPDRTGTIPYGRKPPAWAALSPDLVTPLVPARTAGFLDAVFRQYAAAENELGPLQVIDAVSGHLSHLRRVIPRAQGDTRADLLLVGARFAEFAGWLSQDLGDVIAASYWTDMALKWARESDDRLMTAYTLMRKSNQAAEDRDAALTLELAEGALLDAGSLPPRLRAVVLRQRARGHALRGDGVACARDLERALADADQADADYTDADYCTPAFVALESALCELEMGRPLRAVAMFEQALPSLPQRQLRDRGWYLAHFAEALAARGDAEHACDVANRSLAIASATGSGRITRELRRVRGLLVGLTTDHGVAEFDHALRELP
ncbi:hypothetical protein GCM10014719_49680 [Planomonospora parontospora subsp. antibiotica]|nr:hypothetical protein GCM10014719_49680 [Planomonospora parontospora subsp. antibiotica]GII18393.1 hypothetical protein Ppa05_51190 [Planomonospora parontospora subsp. antibiotica]